MEQYFNAHWNGFVVYYKDLEFTTTEYCHFNMSVKVIESDGKFDIYTSKADGFRNISYCKIAKIIYKKI